MFLRLVDASNHAGMHNFLFHLLDEVVLEVGVPNVIQIIFDNPSNYVVVGTLLEHKYPTIF